MVVALTVTLFLLLLVLGAPIALCLGISGCVGLFLTGGFPSLLSVASTTPFRTVGGFILTTIPMFILMAEFASRGKLASQLFNLANRWIGHLPGGMAIATVGASAGFGAMCGSSVAAAATMSNVTVPEMIKIGYSKRVATGVVAVAGTLAIMIPPSVPMVVYGITTEVSIGKLLIAGIIPGVITATVYSLGIIGWTKVSVGVMPTGIRYSLKERLESMVAIFPFLVVVLAVIGGLYTGVATPSEVAALGAFATLVVCLLMRSIDLPGIIESIRRTVLTSCMIFAIIIGAMIFGYFLTITQTTQNAVIVISQSGLPPAAIMAGLVVLYLILGCFMDQIAILLITLPLTFPLATTMGYDPIWFGVIVVKLVEVGLITPPLGMNVYVTSGCTGVPLEEVFRGVGVMLSFEMVTLCVLLAFPQIALYLPSLMK